jgi:hypothetical protein
MPHETDDRVRYEWLTLRCQSGDPGAFEDLIAHGIAVDRIRRNYTREKAEETQSVWAFLFFVGAMFDLRYRIYQSKVDLLKEVKQVQLQILELQASLGKDTEPPAKQ